MVLSRGLLISLGFTLLVGVLLFFFVKQKTSSIENKINTLFKLVQEEAEKNHKRQLQAKQNNMVVSEVINQSRPSQEGGHEEVESRQNKLITVSDGSESESDSDEDDNESIEDGSDVESDTESESDEDEPQEVEEEEDNQELLQTSTVNFEREINEQNDEHVEIKYVKLDQEEGLEQHNIHMMMMNMNSIDPTVVTLMPTDIEDSGRISLVEDDDESDLGTDIDELTLSDNEDPVEELLVEQVSVQEPTSEEPTSEEPTSEEPTSEEPTSEEPTSKETKVISPTEEFMNYSKLSVKVLREIVSSKGLHPEPSKLKKKELLKVLE